MQFHSAKVAATGASPTALALYERALTQYQSYLGDPIATIEQALADSPDFVRGHALRAMVLTTFGERRFAERARVSVASAEALMRCATDSERELVVAARALVESDWAEGCRALDRVLVRDPHDMLAVQTAHLIDFFRGDALNLRNRIARLLPRWNASVPGYSYLLGMYAFGLEECNQYREAEETARRALDIERKDGWAVHAVAHVLEMQGRIVEGIRWLVSREHDWAPDNGFAFHNYWHLALFYLDQELYDDVLGLYDLRIHTTLAPDPALQLVDATALLWRLHLEGVDIADRARRLADNWAARLDTERGFYVFNDMHAMMAFVMAGRETEADQLAGDLDWTVEHGAGINRGMTHDVGRPICNAIRAFGQARYRDTIDALTAVRDIASRFGGSHAQRDILTLTLVEAAIRGSEPAIARHYLGERLIGRPGGRWGRRLLARSNSPALPADTRLAVGTARC